MPSSSMESTQGVQHDNSHEVTIEKRRSSDRASGFGYKNLHRDRPASQPPPEAKRDIINRPRSSSTSRGNDKSSLVITTDSGTTVTVDNDGATSRKTAGRNKADRKRGRDVTRYDMYKEATYTCMHMLGTPTPERFSSTQEEMCLYVHSAFCESQKEQEKVLEHVRREAFPLTIVNARVKTAHNLRGSKPNGVVDPYCLVTIETEDSVGKLDWKKFSVKSSHKKEKLRKKHLKPKQPPEKRSHQIYENIPKNNRTSVERHKKDPTWDQRFQLLALRPSVDCLTVEVWDHSVDDKDVAKVIRNFSDPSSTENLNSKLKNLPLNSERKKGDVFLGKMSIQISKIPCEGLDQVFQLEGKPQTKDSEAHGKVRVQVWLVHIYRHGENYAKVAEPQIMLRRFWDWILKTEKAECPDPQKWNGTIPKEAECFLFQYALQNGIGEDSHGVIRWEAYTNLDLDLNLLTLDTAMGDLKERIERDDKKKKVGGRSLEGDVDEEPQKIVQRHEITSEMSEESVETHDEYSDEPRRQIVPGSNIRDDSPEQVFQRSKERRSSDKGIIDREDHKEKNRRRSSDGYATMDEQPQGIGEMKRITDGRPKPPSKLRDSHDAIQNDIVKMVKEKIAPVIRNHLKESMDNIHIALKSYEKAAGLLSKSDKPYLLQHIKWLLETALRIGILEWYEELYKKTVPPRGSERIQYVSSVTKVMHEVNALIKSGDAKFGHEFWLTSSLKYLPIVYDELQKLVVHDVEATCWTFFEFYTNHQKLRKILLSNDERDRQFRSEFFFLYVQTDKFVSAQKDIFDGGEAPFCLLKAFHRWFRPTLTLWLGYAVIQGSTMIRKTINIDDNVQDNPTAMTSSSALDTATVFCQLIQFWEQLKWPDIAESYVLLNFLMDVMCSYTILYARLKHAKLEKEGYYDPDGRFDISEQLCTALNNIEHVKETVQNIPSTIHLSDLLERLEETCGKTSQVLDYEKTAKLRLERTIQIVDEHIDDILNNVGRRIQKDMCSYVKQAYEGVLEVDSHKLGDALDPILAYLDENIKTLAHALLPRNFHKVLQLLWNLVCRSMQVIAGKFELHAVDDQFIFYTRLIDVIPELTHYIQGGEGASGLSNAEIETKDFQEMRHLFKYFTMNTDDLIGLYYYTSSQIQMDFTGRSCMGTLRVRVSYWNGKLCVEVLSATDLTPHDEPLTVLKFFSKQSPTSDPMVEVELKPHTFFPNAKKHVTEIKWKSLNPIFEESFYWTVPHDDCLRPGAVILLTVKDYDLLSKNDFLGEAMIPLHVIPGISSQPAIQPMNLPLHEVDKTNPVLTVLHSRNWDRTAGQFYEDEVSRFVEPIIVRKGKECDKYAGRY